MYSQGGQVASVATITFSIFGEQAGRKQDKTKRAHKQYKADFMLPHLNVIAILSQ
jgi:hypothetical protein